MSCRCTARVSPSAYSSAVDTRLPPACLETYMPASATQAIFRGGAVQREAGHPEAARYLALAEHGVGCDPQPQALGKNLRLLHSSFRHKDYELIAAVTRHHV